jgi:hypothetical protein
MGLPRSVYVTLMNGLGAASPPGESCSAFRELAARKPSPLPFLIQVTSLFHLSILTRFISDSHVFSIPFVPGSLPG